MRIPLVMISRCCHVSVVVCIWSSLVNALFEFFLPPAASKREERAWGHPIPRQGDAVPLHPLRKQRFRWLCSPILCWILHSTEKKEHGDTPFPGRGTQSPCTPFASRGFDGYVRQYCVGSYIRPNHCYHRADCK